jgi:hypothetical protein
VLCCGVLVCEAFYCLLRRDGWQSVVRERFRSAESVAILSELPRTEVSLCLLMVSMSTVLQLSANAVIAPTLRNLSLSHNRLTGSIPSAILRFPFANLDLSYNKLEGHITELEDADFQNGTIHDKTGVALTLKVNRLTGDIPHALENAYSIDILTGNVFQCVDYSKLPHEDPAYRYYVCGSDELNQSMIAFVSLMVGLAVCFLLFAAIYYRVRMPNKHR